MVLNKWFDKSLRLKFLGLGLVIVCVSTLTSAYIISRNELNQWNGFLYDKAHSLASYIADISQEAILSGDVLQLDNIVKRINNDPDIVCAVVYDSKGKLLTSLFASINFKSPEVREVISRAPAGVSLMDILGSLHERISGYEASVPVVMGSETLGRVVITLSKDKVHQGIRRTFNGIVFASILALLIAFILLIWFQGVIVKPVLDLVGLMDEVSLRKDYSLRAAVCSRDELGLLTRGFNGMLAEVQTHREQLEAEVERRSAQLRGLQDQLIQSEKMASIGELAAGVAHEINNPVSFIASNLEVLSGYVASYQRMVEMTSRLKEAVEQKSWEAAQNLLEEIRAYEEQTNFAFMVRDVDTLVTQSREGVDRIQQIISDLRTFEREETHWLEEFISIENVLDRSLLIVQAEAKGQVEVRRAYDKPPQVRFDASRIERIFVNVIRNAYQAMPDGGVVELKAYAEPGHVCVEVRDTGCGIPPENLKRIFDPFFTTKSAEKGTGLGLSISYELVKKQGGEIRVESAVGKGTTVTIVLPLPLKKAEKNG
ncbi:MAG: HAMP domain-containing protein [Candidatus Omnitrophica bacterium]|nr:HAMP domain-containing protein [Candidatus Omnitrophota bacterium]